MGNVKKNVGKKDEKLHEKNENEDDDKEFHSFSGIFNNIGITLNEKNEDNQNSENSNKDNGTKNGDDKNKNNYTNTNTTDGNNNTSTDTDLKTYNLSVLPFLQNSLGRLHGGEQL